jgi:hypothetical protein
MILVRGEFAKTYPEAVVAVLKAENDSINELKNGGDAALQKMTDYLRSRSTRPRLSSAASS